MPHSYESKNNHADTHAIDSSNSAVRKTDEESRTTEENKTTEEERSAEGKRSLNFIERIIEQDLESGKRDTVITRFPPEPNGYLHMGHAKSICLNFGLAEKYQGTCHLRFDDTNPEKEEMEYIESIEKDVAWLGFDWGDRIYFASDYFEEIYSAALQLIKDGKAYVDSLSPEEIRAYRGTLKEPGKPSPDRERSIEENVKLFKEMKEGIHEDGKYILRAKIDMNSPNLNMRDPAIYRIKHASHPRTGSTWCIYPMYDFTHPLSDALEGITHSICTLEFEDHRPLYDWTVHETSLTKHEPQQIEFARLNLTYTIMSKRKLLQLVKENYVESWDDPRMPTISGIRRRGYTPAAIRDFSERIGVAKTNSTVEFALLEHCVREDLNKKAARAMAVLDPVRVIIQNYPENTEEWLEGINNPEDESMGTRQIPFSRELYIERDDFMIDPPKKYFRLAPGREVRLKHAYYITCVDYKTDDKGEVQEII
ncbi:MAG: glutamine--tRNA ligase/YqeY domain fusion protein, partial [Spirochaetia bacterium]|nr:glutamine--tRNA ligase/YqeY domain fusion protein [Spirochaetia bacterium]